MWPFPFKTWQGGLVHLLQLGTTGDLIRYRASKQQQRSGNKGLLHQPEGPGANIKTRDSQHCIFFSDEISVKHLGRNPLGPSLENILGSPEIQRGKIEKTGDAEACSLGIDKKRNK